MEAPKMTTHPRTEPRSFTNPDRRPPVVDPHFAAGEEAYRAGKDIFSYSTRLTHHEAGAYMDGWIAEKKRAD